MKIVANLDYINNLDESIIEANNLGIDEIILNYSLHDLKEIDKNSLLQNLKKNKVGISYLDPIIKTPNLGSSNTENFMSEYLELLDIAKSLNINTIGLRLFKINSVVGQFDEIKKVLMPIEEKATKLKINILIIPNDNIYNVYSYLINQKAFNSFKFLFDPITLIENKSPLTTVYRLLNKHITHIYLKDETKKKKIRLFSMGEIKYQALIERIKKDNYNGSFIIDEKMTSFLYQNKKKSFKSWLNKIFAGKLSKDEDIEYHLKHVLNEDNLTPSLIIEKQIKLVKDLFY